MATSKRSPLQLASVVELQYVVLAFASCGDRVHVESQLDAVTAQDFGECLAQRPGLAREHARRDERHFAAETTNSLRHLYADRSGTEHEQSARHGLHAGHFAIRPDPFELTQAGYGRNDRLRTVREDYVLGRVTNAVDFDDAGAGESATAANEVDAVCCEPTLLAGVGVVRNHEVAPRKCSLDVYLRRGSRLVRTVRSFTRTQQRLRRNARVVRALATDQLALDDCDAQTALGERACAVFARRAATEDDDVVLTGHVGKGLPACSAIM